MNKWFIANQLPLHFDKTNFLKFGTKNKPPITRKYNIMITVAYTKQYKQQGSSVYADLTVI
jgi:hypothetical protein